MFLDATGLLAVSASAVFASAVRTWRAVTVMVVAFFLSAALGLPPVGVVGAVVLLVAAGRLVWPESWLLPAVGAGLCAGVWSGVLQSYGVWPAAAWMLAALVPLSTVKLAAERSRFATPAVVDDALVGLAACATVIVAAPAVASGWWSAQAMNLEAGMRAGAALDGWVVALIGVMMVGGGAHSLWRRG